MNRPPVASEMIDYISARVFAGNYRPGSRIPSVRALMRRFNLSYGSALNGISYLCERGLLEKHPKSGVTVSSDPHAQQPAGGCCIGVITSNGTLDNNPGLVYHALSEIQRNALEQDISLIAASGVFDTLSPVLEHCRAVIVMVELDARCEMLPFSAPAVGIFQADDFGGRMSIVDIDPYTTAKQAVGFFRRHRRKRVTVLTDPGEVYRHRARIFEYLWRESGGESGGILVSPFDDLADCAFRREEGYLFTSDHHLQHYAEAWREACGGSLAQRFCLLGIDGKNLMVPEFEHFPTVAADWHNIGRIAFEEAVARLKNPLRPARRIHLAGKLIEPENQED